MIETKTKKLESITQKNMKHYIENDEDILKILENDLRDKISIILKRNKEIDFKKKLPFTEFKHELMIYLKTTDSYIKTNIDEFISVYENYKEFIYYSKNSLTKKELSEDIHSFYFEIKKIKKTYEDEKSIYLFSILRNYLNGLDQCIGKKINTSEWNFQNRFLFYSLHKLQQFIKYLILFYPWMKNSCREILRRLFKIIYYISIDKNIFLYCLPLSRFQISQVFHCNRKDLFELIGKHVSKDNLKLAENIITESLTQRRDDQHIYLSLKHLLHTENLRTNRAGSRVKQLQYIFNYDEFKILLARQNARFKYLDLGGSDGAITSEIGKTLKLPKENVINADISEWFSNELPKNVIDTITYITINEYGRLPFSDSEFSFITAFQSLHHIEDIHNRLSELARIIKPGGFLLIREHDELNVCTKMLIDIDHSMYEVNENKDFTKYLDEYDAYYQSKEKWTEDLSKHGFHYIHQLGYNMRRDYNPTRIYYALYKKI